MRTCSVHGFLGAECRFKERTTEAVLFLWEGYIAWCRSCAEKGCLPDAFFEGLAADGIQVTRGYAHGISLNDDARTRLNEWQYSPVPPMQG